jgi:tRNA 2-selenouridine synthase
LTAAHCSLLRSLLALAGPLPAHKPPASPHLLVVGDSLSAEYGLARGTGWVALLEQRLAEKLAGGGQRQHQRRHHLGRALAPAGPADSSTSRGGGDRTGRQRRPARPAAGMTEANLAAMARRQGRRARCCWWACRCRPTTARAYGEDFALFGTVAQGRGAALVPFLLAGVADGPTRRAVPARPHPPQGRGPPAHAGQRLANIADHIEREAMDKPKHWQPLLYCWRGGQRSGALALVLGQIGFRAHLVEGGYKAFRNAMRADLPAQAGRLGYRVVCGPTGSGKTRLLHALARAGAQVLDLEALASHRSLGAGPDPGQPQPSQKRFEMRIWEHAARARPGAAGVRGGESKKVGNVAVPDALIQAMRASPCLRVELPEDERVALLLEDYPFFVSDPDFFCRRLDTLAALRGRAVVDAWKAQVAAGQTEAVVRELLEKHYDPGYAASTRHHFTQFDQAVPVPLANRSDAALARASVDIAARI